MISLLGDNVTPAILALAVIDAGWASSGIGLVLSAAMVPKIAMFAFGGLLGDVRDRRTIMAAASVLAGAAQALTVVCFALHLPLWTVVAAQAGYGVATAFLRPAASAYLPAVVSQGALARANGLLGSASGLTAVGGPAVGALLVLFVSPVVGLAVDALSFLFSAALLFGLPASRGPASTKRTWSMITEGVRELLSRRWLAVETVASCLMLLLVTSPFFVLGPQLAERMSGATAWPLALAAFGVGQIGGSVLGGWGRIDRPMLLAGAGVALLSLPPVVLVLGLGLSALVMAQVGVGVALGFYNVVMTTAIQRDVPGSVLSRVVSVNYLASFGLAPLGYLLAPVAAGWLGERPAMAGATVGALAVSALLLSARPIRQYTVGRVAA
ncbi:MFS transporter [Micromonospora sp. B11E3]|uniref:MFS transporter n=1 Tax=Micromonospora sp. B11E3 TaxID=3153562 RepID=UPI00325EFB35